MKQTFYDADWYKQTGHKEYYDMTMESLMGLKGLPQMIEVNNRLTMLEADKIGDGLGFQFVIKGNGDEYQRISEIKASNVTVLVPVNFPEKPNVDDPYDALLVPLSQLKHWELAPSNAAKLASANVSFAFTVSGLKKEGDFLKNVKLAVKNGLSKSDALKALTTTPANLIKASGMVGSLENGKLANFLITSGDIFDEDSKLYENWVQGKRYEIEKPKEDDYSGVYALTIGGKSYNLEIGGKPAKPEYKIKLTDTTDVKVKAKMERDLVSLSFNPDKENTEAGDIRLSGWMKDKSMSGNGQLGDGTWVNWSASYKEALKKDEDKKEEEKKEEEPLNLGKVIYPFVAYGNESKATEETILFKNATVWTNEADGIVENADVLVRNGKIAAIGKGLQTVQGAKVVDAKGKHLTSGVIDEHSHIALFSVNEGGQASSAEVSVGDAINSDDINIYRQLSGGVTAAQLLHGSANPIGGQSALIKLKWGEGPDQMKIAGADKYIKFALGENVKQSNWGDLQTVRFPQTRMGVEQVYMDAFTRAKEYDAAWKAYNKLSSKVKARTNPPRRDLELETLAQIINKERFITCHSYVQSEINMLMKVAEKFGFNVNTFTHILEGYKVADKMKAHGVGASTFSDWWAYKFEVRDAIPYNAALMTEQGVVTALNSDDAEMARRLNQEAAKTIKYGGMSEEEAWKMVTLNPAKLLHLDDQMGSIKVGKDADLVLWSDNPLSIYAKAEKTMIDGKVYFDIEKDKEMRSEISKERTRLINKIRSNGSKKKSDEKNGKAEKDAKKKAPEDYFHCDSNFDYYYLLED